MDKLTRYKQIAQQVIEEYGAYKLSQGDIRAEIVIDPVRNHCELIYIGWDGERRVHGSVIHLDVIGTADSAKIWVQHDGTNRGVALDLIDAGVPHSDIVLGFYSEQTRILTDFAVM